MLRGAFQLLAGLAVLLFLLGGSGGGGAFEGGELGLYGGDTVLASYGGGLGFGDGGLGFGEGAEGDFGDCFLGGFLGVELDMVFGGVFGFILHLRLRLHRCWTHCRFPPPPLSPPPRPPRLKQNPR